MSHSSPIPRWWTACNVAGVVSGLLLVVGRLVVNHDPNRGWWAYSAGEWLINYGAGFSRRGLGGQLILALPAPSDLVALEAWLTVQSAVILTLFAIVIQRCLKCSRTPWALAAWLLPTWFVISPLQSLWQPFWINATQFAMRKEQFAVLVVLIAATWWFGPRAPRGFLRIGGAFLVGLLLAAAVLIHEGVAVPAIAAAAVLVRASSVIGHRARDLALLLAPPGAALLAVLLAPGQATSRLPVWLAVDAPTREWYENADPRVFAPMSDGVPGAVSFIGSNPGDGFDLVRSLFLGNGYWIGWLGTALAMTASAVAIVLYVDRSRDAVRRLVIAGLIVGAATAPLFVIAYDWGRWIALAVTLIVIVTLAQISAATEPRPVAWSWPAAAALAAVLIAAALIGVQEVGDARGVLFRGPQADPIPQLR